jgi:hypothetical protein
MNSDTNKIELLHIELSKIPDIELINKYLFDKRYSDILLNFICLNFLVLKRLEAKKRGGEYQTAGVESIDHLIGLWCMFEEALFSLLFEAWIYIKPAAIREGLLKADSKPKDCYRVIRNEQYTMFFEKYEKRGKPHNQTTIYKHSVKAYQHNFINTSALIDPTKGEILKINNMISKDKELNSKLYNLAVDIAFLHRAEIPSLDLAATNFENAVQAMHKHNMKTSHHGNETR